MHCYRIEINPELYNELSTSYENEALSKLETISKKESEGIYVINRNFENPKNAKNSIIYLLTNLKVFGDDKKVKKLVESTIPGKRIRITIGEQSGRYCLRTPFTSEEHGIILNGTNSQYNSMSFESNQVNSLKFSLSKFEDRIDVNMIKPIRSALSNLKLTEKSITEFMTSIDKDSKIKVGHSSEYDTESKILYIDNDIDLNDNYDKSELIHELTHFYVCSLITKRLNHRVRMSTDTDGFDELYDKMVSKLINLKKDRTYSGYIEYIIDYHETIAYAVQYWYFTKLLKRPLSELEKVQPVFKIISHWMTMSNDDLPKKIINFKKRWSDLLK